ncbi:hypothetical protein GF312_08865 [Candidatus Poribacteria bacterium]|nr:hypothetical protein [Candidatus Poribacteria bacterium]
MVEAEESGLDQNNNFYLYCIFRGIPDIESNPGIDRQNKTFFLSHQNLGALVSSVSRDKYNEDALEKSLQNIEWLTPRVRTHEKIIRTAMENHSIIPMRFGTIYSDSKKIIDILVKGFKEFNDYFDVVDGKEEWGIKVYAENDAGSEEIAKSSKEIVDLDKRIAHMPPGKAYLLKKKRESLISKFRTNYLKNLSNSIYKTISSWCIAGCRNKLLGRNATGKNMDMILNSAFLIDKKSFDNFKKNLDKLALRHKPSLILFELSGPWPCYNFCPEFNVFKEE